MHDLLWVLFSDESCRDALADSTSLDQLIEAIDPFSPGSTLADIRIIFGVPDSLDNDESLQFIYELIANLKVIFDNQEAVQVPDENDDELSQVAGGFIAEAVGAVIGGGLNLANTKVAINGQLQLSTQDYKYKKELMSFQVDETIRLWEAQKKIMSS